MRLPDSISKRSVVAVLLLSSAVTSALGARFADWARPKLEVMLSPFSDAGMYVSTSLRSRLASLGLPASRPDPEKEQLRAQADQLRYALESERLKYLEQMQTYHIGEQLFGQISDGFRCTLIPARVVASDPLPYGANRIASRMQGYAAPLGASVTTRDIFTDRSKALPDNLAAMTTEALVGRIVESGEFTARLQLVTDRGFKVNACLWRNPAIGREAQVTVDGSQVRQRLTDQNSRPIPVQVQGDGKDRLVVRQQDANNNYQPGDWLVTAGDSRFMPDRIRIGKVDQVLSDRDHPLLVTLTIKPDADLATLRNIYIVVPLNEPRGGD